MANKIPRFPAFKCLSLDDRAEVDHFIRKFPPYSDFNFASIWSYDTCGDHALAWLNGNLVVRLRDYLTGEPIFTFLGTQDIPATIETLFEYSSGMGLRHSLRLLPENVYTQCNGSLASRFDFAEDEASFDYILDLTVLEAMAAPGLGSKRRQITKLRREHPDLEVRTLDLTEAAMRGCIMRLCETWRAEKKRDRCEFATERIAIERAINDARHFQFVAVGAYVAGVLVGFTINEPVHDRFFMAHFGKTDPKLPGLCEFLESETARIMRAFGCSWMNYQQDLGLLGLRQYKRSWGHYRFLKKLNISEKS